MELSGFEMKTFPSETRGKIKTGSKTPEGQQQHGEGSSDPKGREETGLCNVSEDREEHF